MSHQLILDTTLMVILMVLGVVSIRWGCSRVDIVLGFGYLSSGIFFGYKVVTLLTQFV